VVDKHFEEQTENDKQELQFQMHIIRWVASSTMNAESEVSHVRDNQLMLSQFFNKEKNEVLFKLYSILQAKMSYGKCKEDIRESMGYTELCNQYNKQYKTSNKHS
jgi:hypothetical protein